MVKKKLENLMPKNIIFFPMLPPYFATTLNWLICCGSMVKKNPFF